MYFLIENACLDLLQHIVSTYKKLVFLILLTSACWLVGCFGTNLRFLVKNFYGKFRRLQPSEKSYWQIQFGSSVICALASLHMHILNQYILIHIPFFFSSTFILSTILNILYIYSLCFHNFTKRKYTYIFLWTEPCNEDRFNCVRGLGTKQIFNF